LSGQLLSVLSTPNLTPTPAERTIVYGFCWALISCSLILFAYGYYLVISFTELNHLALQHFIPGGLFIVGGILFWLGYKEKARRKLYWPLSTLVLTLFWLGTAYAVLDLWQDRAIGEKILLIGFFSLLLAWYTRLKLMLLSQALLIAGYSYLVFTDPILGLMDQFLAAVKLPLLISLLLLTLRNQYQFGLKMLTENEKLVDSLRSMSYTDELTGLANRKGFYEALKDDLDNADRFHAPLSLIIVDVDDFKQYNDSFGHPLGDICLRKLSTILTDQAQRAVDTVARIGGEEFALILPSSNTKQAVQLADKIQHALTEAAITHGESSVADQVTVSIGISTYQQDDEESFYQKADQALNRAKKKGKNRYEIASLLDCNQNA
jgi:diguanylate cyclase (GGDEF)-like protein